MGHMKSILTAAAATATLLVGLTTPADAVTRTWMVFGTVNLFGGTGEIISADVRGSFDFDADANPFTLFNGDTVNLGAVSNVNITVSGYDEDVTEPLTFDGVYNSVQGFANVDFNPTDSAPARPFLRVARDLSDPDTITDANGQIVGTNISEPGTQVLFLAFDEILTSDPSQNFVDLNNPEGIGIYLSECANEFSSGGVDFCIGEDTQAGTGRNGQEPDGMGGFLDLNAGFITTVVPVPAAAPLLLTGLAGFGWIARRRKKKLAAA